MRRALIAVLATVAIGYATPALAQAVNPDVSGTPDGYQIYGVQDKSGNPVYGTSPANNSPVNVTFDGGVGQTVEMSITNGFAQISDANAKTDPNWTQLIINPDLTFDDMKFAISLTGGSGTVDVYYLLAGGPTSDANNPANYTLLGTINADGSNKNFELSGGNFNGLMLQVSDGQPDLTLGTVKQMSYNLAPGVPEPGTWALMLLGFGGVGAAMRRSRKRQPGLMQIA